MNTVGQKDTNKEKKKKFGDQPIYHYPWLWFVRKAYHTHMITRHLPSVIRTELTIIPGPRCKIAPLQSNKAAIEAVASVLEQASGPSEDEDTDAFSSASSTCSDGDL